MSSAFGDAKNQAAFIDWSVGIDALCRRVAIMSGAGKEEPPGEMSASKSLMNCLGRAMNAGCRENFNASES